MAEDRKKTISAVFLATYNELSRHLSRRLARKADAEDVLQNTFLRIQKIPADAEIANPRSYLFRMADNLAIDHTRSQRAIERHVKTEEPVDKADESPLPERVVDYRQRLSRLRQAVSELPDRQRQVFLMHKFDGMSHAEIANELGITKSAVEKLIMKALAHLRDRVGHLID
jgi:RNA polymerase sigma-70 factor (ECF subfamily)